MMADDLENSPAYAVLSGNARSMLRVIRSAAADDCTTVSLTYAAFVDERISRPSIRHCLHQLEALCFVRIERGPRRINNFTLLPDYKNLSANQVAERRVLARAPRPRLPSPPRKVVPARPRQIAKPETPAVQQQYQVPSLPKLRFMGEI